MKEDNTMHQLWKIHRAYLTDALDLAHTMLEEADYSSIQREKGLVKWEEQTTDLTHICNILFRSFIGTLNQGVDAPGYIFVQACDCGTFLEIINSFGKKLQQRQWLDEEQFQYITI